MLTSHYMEDIRLLCPRSIVIHEGEKIYDGDTAKLFEEQIRAGNYRIRDALKRLNIFYADIGKYQKSI